MKDADGNDHIVLCDVALLQNRNPQSLCLQYP